MANHLRLLRQGAQSSTPLLRPIGALPPSEEEEGYSRELASQQVPHFDLGESHEQELSGNLPLADQVEEEVEEESIGATDETTPHLEPEPSEPSQPSGSSELSAPQTTAAPPPAGSLERRRKRSGAQKTRFVGSSSAPSSPPPPSPPLKPQGRGKKKRSFSKQLREPPRCIVARTALILPFAFATAGEDKFLDQGPGEWLSLLLERTVTLATGETVPIWEVYKDLPFEVSELSPQFRQLIGWKEKGRKFIETWRARRLTLRKPVLDALFPNARLWALERGEEEDYEVSKRVQLYKIELHLLAMGSGILVFFLDWLARPADSMRLEDLRKWLSVSKFRHTVPKVALGWSFSPLEGSGGGGGGGGGSTAPTPSTTTPPPLPEDSDVSRRRRSRSLASYKPAKRGEWSPELPSRKAAAAAALLTATPTTTTTTTTATVDQPHPTPPPLPPLGPAGIPPGIAPQHLHDLGPRLSQAIYGSHPVSLSTIGNWLLAFSNESAVPELPQRVTYGRYVYHQTVAVLERKPADEVLYEYLYHLRRAFEATNVPPPTLDEAHRMDDLLIPRKNRYVGLSREGNISLSWPLREQKEGWEQKQWPKKFLGIFLLLAVHIHGERVVLDELSYLTSLKADALTLGASADYEELLATRQQLRDLATLMIRYTLSMSSDDCGGPSAYSEFFTAMRDVLRVPDARNELREEIDDVLALVESGYSEERRRRKILAKREMAMWNHIRETSKRRFEIVISILTAFTLPLVVLSGIFGMNLSDLPDPSFGPLIGGTMGVSMLFVIALLVFLAREKKVTEKKIESIRDNQAFKEMEKEEEALTEQRPPRKTLRQMLQGRSAHATPRASATLARSQPVSR